MTIAKAFSIAFERCAIMIASGSVATIIFAWWRDMPSDWTILFSWPFMLMIALTSILVFLKHYGEQR